MPQLRSGRHFGYGPSPWIKGLSSGTDEQRYTLVFLFRTKVPTPEKLWEHLQIVYYKTDEGEPPNAPAYYPGYMIRDVLAGKAGWTTEEIEELQEQLSTNQKLQDWLVAHWSEIDQCIKNNSLWQSPLMTDD
jgi:hypothetical protein